MVYNPVIHKLLPLPYSLSISSPLPFLFPSPLPSTCLPCFPLLHLLPSFPQHKLRSAAGRRCRGVSVQTSRSATLEPTTPVNPTESHSCPPPLRSLPPTISFCPPLSCPHPGFLCGVPLLPKASSSPFSPVSFTSQTAYLHHNLLPLLRPHLPTSLPPQSPSMTSSPPPQSPPLTTSPPLHPHSMPTIPSSLLHSFLSPLQQLSPSKSPPPSMSSFFPLFSTTRFPPSQPPPPPPSPLCVLLPQSTGITSSSQESPDGAVNETVNDAVMASFVPGWRTLATPVTVFLLLLHSSWYNTALHYCS